MPCFIILLKIIDEQNVIFKSAGSATLQDWRLSIQEIVIVYIVVFLFAGLRFIEAILVVMVE